MTKREVANANLPFDTNSNLLVMSYFAWIVNERSLVSSKSILEFKSPSYENDVSIYLDCIKTYLIAYLEY